MRIRAYWVRFLWARENELVWELHNFRLVCAYVGASLEQTHLDHIDAERIIVICCRVRMVWRLFSFPHSIMPDKLTRDKS